MDNKPTFKFKTNIPTPIHFISERAQTGKGQYGEWFRYDVVVDDMEQSLFASKGLQDRLSKIGNLSGRNLEIMKREGEGNRIFWEIRENGVDITPEIYPASHEEQPPLPIEENPPQKNNLDDLEKRLEKIEKDLEDLKK